MNNCVAGALPVRAPEAGLQRRLHNRRSAGRDQFRHRSPFDELVEIVHFATRPDVSIDEGKVCPLKLGEKPLPADFLHPDACGAETEEERPRMLVALECRRTRI